MFTETLGAQATKNKYTDLNKWKQAAKSKGYRIEQDTDTDYSAINQTGIDMGGYSKDTGGYFAESASLAKLKQLAGIKQLNEGSPAFVAKQQSDGTIYASHVHYDGYPEGLGAVLQKYYSNPNKLEDAISGGDASSWDKKSIDYYAKRSGESVANNAPQEVRHLADVKGFAEYYYLLTPKGWMYGKEPGNLTLLGELKSNEDSKVDESMYDILEKVRQLSLTTTTNNTCDQIVDEWANSVESRYKDNGQIMDQPEGEIIDNSLRQYLDATPQKVTIAETDILESEMHGLYAKFVEDASGIHYDGVADDLSELYCTVCHKEFEANEHPDSKGRCRHCSEQNLKVVDEAEVDLAAQDDRPVYTNTETGKQTRFIPKGMRSAAPRTSPRPKPNPARSSAPVTSPRPKPNPARSL